MSLRPFKSNAKAFPELNHTLYFCTTATILENKFVNILIHSLVFLKSQVVRRRNVVNGIIVYRILGRKKKNSSPFKFIKLFHKNTIDHL